MQSKVLYCFLISWKMSMLLSIYFILAEILIVNSAPKLGNVLFDPLTFEADTDDDKHERIIRKNNNYNVSREPKTETKQESASSSSEDFLENSEVITESTSVLNKVENIGSHIQDGFDNSDDRPTTRATDENNKPSTLLKKLKTYDNFKLTTPKNTVITTKNYRNSFILKYILRNKGGQDSVQKSGYDYDGQICTLINGRIMCGYEKNTGTIESDKQITTMNSECHIRGDRIECGYGRPSNNPVKRLKGSANQNVSKLLSNLKDNVNASTDEINATRQGVKTLSSLLCTDCIKPSTPESEETTEVPETEVITPQKIEISSNEKEEPSTSENNTTSIILELETSTSNLEKIAPSESTNETVKTLNHILRNNSEPKDSYEEQTEKPVTRCVENGDRIVCFNKFKNTTKPSVAK